MKAPIKSKRRFIYPMLLLLTYSLHLVVFNAMMDASFQIKENLAHFCFDPNSQTNSAHPCLAADYQRLLKHEDDKKHTFNYESCITPALVAFAAVTVLNAPAQKVSYTSPLSFSLPDNAYRRYSLLNVFLI